jgi:hypothetical protein
MTGQAVRLRSFRAKTFYQSAAELETHEEIAFARSSITHNSKRPHPKAKELECLSRSYFPIILIATQSLGGEG